MSLDPSPPAALFVRGDLGVLDARRVGIVGTRNATLAGRETAAALGCDLATAGIAVVSGLARGIDGAAHRGALAAGESAGVGRPVAVVGNGADVPYPKQNAELWSAVCDPRRAHVGVATGNPTRGVPVPDAEPDPRGPV